MGCGQSTDGAVVAAANVTTSLLRRQDDQTSEAIIKHLGKDAAFLLLSQAEGNDIVLRDRQDDAKLAEGIRIAVAKGVLAQDPVVAATAAIEVAGKSADDVASEILKRLPADQGNVIVLQGLSGTGKGTTVKKLQEKLPNCVCWSNGNLFRTFTHLASLQCEADHVEFSADALTPELLDSIKKRIEFKKFDDAFDVVIDGETRVSSIQNTLLKMPHISARVPIVAERTQGEVVTFAAAAVEQMKASGCNVILEGRAQTLNYIPSELRFELSISEPTVLGQRRAAQRVMARAMELLGERSQEALDADVAAAVKEAAQQLAGRDNMAVIFIKPHAQVDGMKAFVESEIAAAGITIVNQGELSGSEIDAKGTIDSHYAAIGQYAMKTAPKDLPVSASKKAEFEEKFGANFDAAAESGKIINTADAMKQFQLTGPEVGQEFERGKVESGMLKLMPGCYVAPLKDRDVFLINGFYGSMRAEYVDPAAKVTWFVLKWNENALSWAQFRRDVLGATDPTAAVPSSIRAKILAQHKSMNLPFEPTTSKNCVHGSASPLEGFNERRIWTGAQPSSDPFGAELLARGVREEQLEKLCANPLYAGKPLFDVVEDTNTSICLLTLVAAAKLL